jgi:hypothetical protein
MKISRRKWIFVKSIPGGCLLSGVDHTDPEHRVGDVEPAEEAGGRAGAVVGLQEAAGILLIIY